MLLLAMVMAGIAFVLASTMRPTMLVSSSRRCAIRSGLPIEGFSVIVAIVEYWLIRLKKLISR